MRNSDTVVRHQLTPGFWFEVHKTLEHSRVGVLMTPHGAINTPVFMPVGTQASVKSLDPLDVEQAGAEILLANTYHLYLRPGEAVVEQLGGLHQFMGWNHPILTDSGGYQVSSLGLFKTKAGTALTTIDDDGVTFTSHLDGSKHRFTPEKVMEIEHMLGADIIMAFDEATPDMGKTYAAASMERTHRWLLRCKQQWMALEEGRGGGENNQALFGIIQGGNYRDLRRESASFVASCDLPGIALGGGSVGQNPDVTDENYAWVRDLIPAHKPVYFMGVGVKPSDVVAAIKSGADMFDCVAPTKLARTGLLYTGHLKGLEGKKLDTVKFVSEDEHERIAIEKKQYETDDQPIDSTCDCATCTRGFTRAYLRHLYRSRELLYYRLASIHNVRMMVRTAELMRDFIRTHGHLIS